MAAGPAAAQAVKSEVAAPNGVVVTVHSDEFAERYEYTGPALDLADGFAFVARVDRAGEAGVVEIIGTFIYSGDWRFYDGALFRGGEAAEFIETGRNVGRCGGGGRYSRPSCSLNEGFKIRVTPEQRERLARDGKLDIQIRSGRSTQTAMLSVPLEHFDAVAAVADTRD